MPTTDKSAFIESNGNSVRVTADAAVSKGEIVYWDGFLGVLADTSTSAEDAILTIDQREYQFYVPDAVSVSKGDVVYIDVDSLTGAPADDDYDTDDSGMTTPRALFMATSDKVTANGSGKHYATGILLPHGIAG